MASTRSRTLKAAAIDVDGSPTATPSAPSAAATPLPVPPTTSFDDDHDFGLDSADEKELINLSFSSSGPKNGSKRKNPPTDEEPQSKRLAVNAFPTTSEVAVDILKKTFCLGAFRLKQEAAIARLLAGGSAVTVFPTGGGKSLCYQIPALGFSEMDRCQGIRGQDEGGITLVISPLIALMKDQVDLLVGLGIKAACLDSTKSREEYLETSELMRQGTLKILYCAPERLNNEGFIEQMKSVRGGIRLVAVDEAHCISEWGHAFRPDYLKVSRFIKEIKAERVICLTATATIRVAQDICEAFDVDKGGLFRTSTYRPNLKLLAESAATKQDLYPRLFNFLKSNPGPSIIYVTLQKQTEALAEDLRSQGFNAKAFHAGMQTLDKSRLQDQFKVSNNLLIVATIAFGMGIDKADVRNVIHFNIPSSLESYSQEIGRAGRDGQASNCLFYVCGEDLHLREVFARGDLPSLESIRSLLGEIFSSTNTVLAVGETIEASHYEQQRQFDIRATTLSNIYAQLELRFGLIRAVTPMFTKYSYIPGSNYDSKIKSDNSTAAAAIRVFAIKAKTMFHIDVNAAARSKAIQRADVVRKLNEWNEHQVINLRVAGVLNVYRVQKTLPSSAAEISSIAKDVYNNIEAREKQALDRTDEVLDLITGSACFSRTLANHFGDDLPEGRTECGHCTWCEKHKPIVLKKPPPIPLDHGRLKAILERIPERDDARFLARVAFGILSPRVTLLKLSNDPIFMSMMDHEFTTLLAAFASACSSCN